VRNYPADGNSPWRDEEGAAVERTVPCGLAQVIGTIRGQRALALEAAVICICRRNLPKRQWRWLHVLKVVSLVSLLMASSFGLRWPSFRLQNKLL
jgi:hypothetical protein